MDIALLSNKQRGVGIYIYIYIYIYNVSTSEGEGSETAQRMEILQKMGTPRWAKNVLYVRR